MANQDDGFAEELGAGAEFQVSRAATDAIVNHVDEEASIFGVAVDDGGLGAKAAAGFGATELAAVGGDVGEGEAIRQGGGENDRDAGGGKFLALGFGEGGGGLSGLAEEKEAEGGEEEAFHGDGIFALFIFMIRMGIWGLCDRG